MFERNKLLLTILLLIVLIGIPITLYLVRRQQELRGRAVGNPVSLLLAPETLSKVVGETFDVLIFLNASDSNISGIDITITFSKDVFEVTVFQPAATFNNEFFKTPIATANESGMLRYVAGSTTTSPITGAAVPIGTLSLRGRGEGIGTVSFQTVTVTASGIPTFLPTTNNLTGSYRINQLVSITPVLSPTPLLTEQPTSTPTSVPTPTPSPTVAPVVVTPTPTPSPIPPTSIPSQTTTPTSPSDSTTLNIAFRLQGVTNPTRTQRVVEVKLLSTQAQEMRSETIPVTFQNGVFRGSLDLGASFVTGSYIVKLKVNDMTLRKRVDNVTAIAQGQVHSLREVDLVSGDTNNDNRINAVDYSYIVGCLDVKRGTASYSCPNTALADANDDGRVTTFDLAILIINLSNREGD